MELTTIDPFDDRLLPPAYAAVALPLGTLIEDKLPEAAPQIMAVVSLPGSTGLQCCMTLDGRTFGYIHPLGLLYPNVPVRECPPVNRLLSAPEARLALNSDQCRLSLADIETSAGRLRSVRHALAFVRAYQRPTS